MKEYFVYILTNKSRTLYTGVTGDIEGRMWQHKQGKGSSFTSRYKINQLVYYESCSDILEAIAREKQIKGWLRAKKIALIESMNPNWEDLSADWYDEGDSSLRSE
jgi:putative endonuclease